jgi:dihydrofolate reductase
VAKLIYTAITSLDGYVADENGNFDWAAPDEEVHSFVNDLERPIGTYLFGRRMYEVMRAWETMPDDPEQPIMQEYAEIWRAADKVVYSTTLAKVSTRRTRLERTFDADAVRRMKDSASHELGIGGPTLAAHALRAGLVDEVLLFLNPIVVGGGNAALPHDVVVPLDLLDERRFTNGVIFLRYEVLRA